MKTKLVSLFLLLSAALALQLPAHAAGPAPTLATKQMARIILAMESQPNKDAKITLEDIAKDRAATGNERQIASSMLHMDKKVRPEDKATLMKIWLSPAAAETERSLAKALLKFDEKPDDRVKAALNSFDQEKQP